MSIYTLGIWTVKSGHEDDFIAAWKDLGDRTKADFPGATATLLRDRDQPNRFISFGPWDSIEQIEQWRGSETFKKGVARLREVLEGFAPSTMEVAAEVR